MILKKNKLLRPNIFHSADKGYKKNRQRYQAVGSYYDYTILLSDMLICSEVLQQAGLFRDIQLMPSEEGRIIGRGCEERA